MRYWLYICIDNERCGYSFWSEQPPTSDKSMYCPDCERIMLCRTQRKYD